MSPTSLFQIKLMPKRFIFIFSLLFLILNTYYLIRNTSPVFAYNPIIIEKSILGPPPSNSSGEDMNYHANDVFNSEVVTCSDDIMISQTFEPIQIGTSNGQPIFQTQQVGQIEGKYDLSDTYTSLHPGSLYIHGGQESLKCVDKDCYPKTLRSFESSKDEGSSNMSRRSTTNRELRCLRGQRLIRAVESLDPSYNGITTNEQIAWNCGGKTPLFGSDGSGCTPIRLADIAHALASELIFYDPTLDCNTNPDPITLPLRVPKPNPVSYDDALVLLETNVEAVDTGSMTRGIKMINKNTGEENEKFEHMVPRGQVFAHNKTQLGKMSITQVAPPISLCSVVTQGPGLDKPNPINVIVKIIQDFGEVVDKAKTFFAPVKVETLIPKEMETGITTDEAFLKDLITERDINDKGLKNQPGSSNQGKGYDPGGTMTRSVFTQNLLPMKF